MIKNTEKICFKSQIGIEMVNNIEMASHLFVLIFLDLFEKRRYNMRKVDVKMTAINAMIACIYAILTIVCSSFSYGGIQLRISEIMVFLAFYNKKYIPGLVIGCFLANLASPLGIADICFGTFATFIACLGMYQIKQLLIAGLFGALVNGIIVGLELYFVLDLPFFMNAFYVFLGEFIVLMMGVYLFNMIERKHTFTKYIRG